MTTSHKSGFTLIELSIVLVIIGLLVGGVLVGKDLIKSSEIRSQVSQIVQLNTAVNTFKLKYGGLPGDLPIATSASFGFFSVDPSPTACDIYTEDGNGYITDGQDFRYIYGEPIIFWRHLSEAKLIDGSYSMVTGTAAGNIDDCGLVAVNATNVAEINAYLPPAKIGKGASITVGSKDHGPNYYALAGLNQTSSNWVFKNSTNVLTPQEAANIDIKMDDGNPSTGSVLADNAAFSMIKPMPGMIFTPKTTCVSSGAYVVSGTTSDCSLQIKFQ